MNTNICNNCGGVRTIGGHYYDSPCDSDCNKCGATRIVPGHQGGVLVRMLSEEGVMVSSGSACASETDTPSPALTALGFRKKEAWSGLRISFDNSSRPEEVKFLLSSLESVLKKY